MFDAMKTAKNIRRARFELGITQEELADASGVSVSSIRLYENGTADMGLPNACKIADALGVTIAEMVATS